MPPAARTVAFELTSTAAGSRAGRAAHASGHSSRDACAAGVLARRQLPRDERGARRALAGRHVGAEPVAGDHCVLVVTEHLLQAGHRRREPLRALADRGCDRLGRVPAPAWRGCGLRAARRREDRRPAPPSRSAASSTASAPDRRGRARGRRGRRPTAHRARRSEEAFEQIEVARRSAWPPAARRARRRVGRGDRRAGARPARSLGASSAMCPSSRLERARRCRAPRRASRPATSARRAAVRPRRGRRTGRNVRRSERMRRVATRAWCTSSGSVAEADAGVVGEQPRGRADDRGAQHLGGGRREVEARRRHEVGGVEGA